MKFGTRSFRIGVASTAAALDTTQMKLNGWVSGLHLPITNMSEHYLMSRQGPGFVLSLQVQWRWQGKGTSDHRPQLRFLGQHTMRLHLHGGGV